MIAHRGGAGSEHRESSREAFVAAARMGYAFFELDLRADAFGRLAIWHGAGRERIATNEPFTPRPGSSPLYFDELIPLLGEDARFFLDLKNRPAVSALGALVDRCGLWDRVCIGSFSQMRTQTAAQLLHDHHDRFPPTALTPQQIARCLVPQIHVPSFPPNIVSAQVPSTLAKYEAFRVALQAKGILVIAWTVNDKAEMELLLSNGVDGIMTDEPAILSDVCRAHSPTAEFQEGA